MSLSKKVHIQSSQLKVPSLPGNHADLHNLIKFVSSELQEGKIIDCSFLYSYNRILAGGNSPPVLGFFQVKQHF